MLIYCARIPLVPSESDDSLLSAVGAWLTAKTNRTITADVFDQDGGCQADDGNAVEWLSACHEGEQWRAIRLSHPDRATDGREWLTEIGVHRNRGEFLCSVLLRTHERSALVDPNVQTTRPKVVAEIFERCRVSSDTCGGLARPLRLADAEAFLYEVRRPDRTHPIVQISCTRDGAYLMNPERTAAQLAGVALVAVIPTDVDTFALEEALDGRYCCYHGAINIIWPRTRADRNGHVPFQRIMAHDIEAVRESGKWPESRLLATLCHRMNEVYARDHISPEMVRAARHRAALAEARRSAPRVDPDFEELVRQVEKDQTEEIARLKGDIKGRDEDLANARNRVEELERENESLKVSLANAGQRVATAGEAMGTNARGALLAAASDDFSLTDALRVLSIAYPDRIVILDSAWRSAGDASEFKHPRRAFGLLNVLCSAYWEALVSGQGDGDARSTFGNAFSARESETVEGNKRARKLRTFVYKGQSVEMMAHLRIGNKDSRAETWRAHFMWDPADRRIVLGHCGKHLDHK